MAEQADGHLQTLEVMGVWNNQEKLKSSTWREIEAVKRVLYSNYSFLQGRKIKVFYDNKNVKTVLKAGSMKDDLQSVALDVYNLCTVNGITLIPEWVPREANERADYLSRNFDCDDWEIDHSVFSLLDKAWGPHTVDRFSSNYNNKCVRFNSRWWVQEAEAVNAFDQCWSGECNWLVPPPRLISLCLQKLHNDKAKGTLVVPDWHSAPFWSFLMHTDGSFRFFVQDFRFLSRSNSVKAGRGNNGIFAQRPLHFSMIALKIKYT